MSSPLAGWLNAATELLAPRTIDVAHVAMRVIVIATPVDVMKLDVVSTSKY